MSLRNVEGVVNRIVERPVNTRRGQAIAYNVAVETGAGEEWFSFGFKNPGIGAGQQIRFAAVEKNGFWNGDGKSLEVLKTAPTPAAPSASGAMKSAVAAADLRQRSIVWQSSYKTAAEIAGIAVAHDLMPAMPARAKKNDKYDFLMSLIHDIALGIYSEALNPPEPLEFVDDDEEEIEEASLADEDYDPV